MSKLSDASEEFVLERAVFKRTSQPSLLTSFDGFLCVTGFGNVCVCARARVCVGVFALSWLLCGSWCSKAAVVLPDGLGGIG